MIETSVTTVDIAPSGESTVEVVASSPSITNVVVGDDGTVQLNTVQGPAVEVLAGSPNIVTISVIQEPAVVLTADPPVSTTVTVGTDGVVYVETPQDQPVEITTGPLQIVSLEPLEEVAVVLVTPAVQGPIGPVGPIGPPGGNVTLRAGEDISAFSAIRVGPTGYLLNADCTNQTSLGTVLGLTTQDYTSGDIITVATSGLVSNSNWSFTSGKKVFVGQSGEVVQVLPAESLFQQPVGIMLSSNLMLINIEAPIVIA